MNLRSERIACVVTHNPLARGCRALVFAALAVTVSGAGNAMASQSVHDQMNVRPTTFQRILRAPIVDQLSVYKGDVANTAGVKSFARACEGETAGKSPLQVALRHYIKGAEPIPRRFLSVVGTDSAVSEAGMKVLAEYGPTYYYTGSDAVKAKLKDNLERIGPYPALLVVVRSNKKVNATTQSVRVGGHYISGEFDGKVATSREYTLLCAEAGWVIKESKEEPAK